MQSSQGKRKKKYLPIFELNVDFTIERTANINPHFTDVHAVTQVTTPIKPVINNGSADTILSLKLFAGQFEATFKNKYPNGILLKIAIGTSKDETGNENLIWVVRFDKTGKNGISYTIDNSSQYFFAPTPLSNTLVSSNVSPVLS